MLGVKVRVFMVRSSSRQKPGRRTLIEMFGGEVTESPSPLTRSGMAFFGTERDHPGSLGIAISEAVEQAMEGRGAKYALGSVLDAVMLHQSVIGQEALQQLREAGAFPDVVIGCVGGGSNFAGLAFPLLAEALRGNTSTRFVAVEPESCPSLTGGDLRYDNGDTAGLTPLLYMHTLGRDFIPPPIHAGGLRYHGMSPLVSHLVSLGRVEAIAISQEKAFEAARIFLQAEGILPAPESSHAAAVAIAEASEARESGRSSTILFNLSGHGLLDISAFAS
jgi:tryptophan synthase beta chain